MNDDKSYRDKYLARLDDLLAAEQQISDQLSEILTLQKALEVANARLVELEALVQCKTIASEVNTGRDVNKEIQTSIQFPTKTTRKNSISSETFTPVIPLKRESSVSNADSDSPSLVKPPMDSSVLDQSSMSHTLKKVKNEITSGTIEFSEPTTFPTETPCLLLDSGPHTLISWTQLIKEEWPKGTLVGLSKAKWERINEAVIEFLSEKGLSSELIAHCVVHEGLKVKKPVSAIPVYLRDDFPDWLNNRLDAGMLHLHNLKKRDKNDGGPEVNVLVQKGDLIMWIDLANTQFRSELHDIFQERDYSRRVRTGVEEFIQSHCLTVGKKKEDCVVRKPGSSKLFPAIPVLLQEQFLQWFKHHLMNCFWDYETSSALIEIQKKSLKENICSDVD